MGRPPVRHSGLRDQSLTRRLLVRDYDLVREKMANVMKPIAAQTIARPKKLATNHFHWGSSSVLPLGLLILASLRDISPTGNVSFYC